MVKKSNLEKFLRLGGYDAVIFKGNTWRGIAEARRKTGLSEMTIRRLLKEYPTPPSETQGRYVWMTPEQDSRFEDALSQLRTVGKQLETVRRYFEQSLIVDLMELRARKELQGWTNDQLRELLRKQVEAEKKEQGTMERLFNDTVVEYNIALNTLLNAFANLRSR